MDILGTSSSTANPIFKRARDDLMVHVVKMPSNPCNIEPQEEFDHYIT
jgi:hypothetical protein